MNDVRGWATLAAMALLSQMMRTVAITGRTDTINAWFANRQGGRWAEQTVAAAFPMAAPDATHGSPPAGRDPSLADPTDALRKLTELRQRGVLTDAEAEGLRARLHV
jgi:hypothetical protein